MPSCLSPYYNPKTTTTMPVCASRNLYLLHYNVLKTPSHSASQTKTCNVYYVILVIKQIMSNNLS